MKKNRPSQRAESESDRTAASIERAAVALERIADALERRPPAPEDFDGALCWRWEAGSLSALPPPADELGMLHGLDDQISAVDNNTKSLARGGAANHALLTGPRGAGKSSVVRGVFARRAAAGLRLIETDAAGLAALPALAQALASRSEKFIVYCDDLSFGQNPESALFQKIKSAMEGGVAAAGNMRVYATSNRRRLAAERFEDNFSQFSAVAAGEIHGGESADEIAALSDRFGLWIPFFDIDDGLFKDIAAGWLEHFGLRPTPARLQAARQWAEARGALNGRMARHFAAAAANRTA